MKFWHISRLLLYNELNYIRFFMGKCFFSCEAIKWWWVHKAKYIFSKSSLYWAINLGCKCRAICVCCYAPQNSRYSLSPAFFALLVVIALPFWALQAINKAYATTIWKQKIIKSHTQTPHIINSKCKGTYLNSKTHLFKIIKRY